MNDWVVNKPPTESGTYLVTEQYLQDVTERRVMSRYYSDSMYGGWESDSPYYHVIAWKNLPEPYRETNQSSKL